MNNQVHLVTDDCGTWCEAKTEDLTQTTDALDLTTCLPCLEALIKQTIGCMMRIAYEYGCKRGPLSEDHPTEEGTREDHE